MEVIKQMIPGLHQGTEPVEPVEIHLESGHPEKQLGLEQSTPRHDVYNARDGQPSATSTRRTHKGRSGASGEQGDADAEAEAERVQQQLEVQSRRLAAKLQAPEESSRKYSGVLAPLVSADPQAMSGYPVLSSEQAEELQFVLLQSEDVIAVLRAEVDQLKGDLTEQRTRAAHLEAQIGLASTSAAEHTVSVTRLAPVVDRMRHMIAEVRMSQSRGRDVTSHMLEGGRPDVAGVSRVHAELDAMRALGARLADELGFITGTVAAAGSDAPDRAAALTVDRTYDERSTVVAAVREVIDEAKARLRKLEGARNASLRARLDRLPARYAGLSAQNARLQDELAQLRASMLAEQAKDAQIFGELRHELQRSKDDAAARVHDARAAIAKLEFELETTRATADDQVLALQRASESDALRMEALATEAETLRSSARDADTKRSTVEATVAKLEAELAEVRKVRGLLMVHTQDAEGRPVTAQMAVEGKDREVADLSAALCETRALVQDLDTQGSQLREDLGRAIADIQQLETSLREKNRELERRRSTVELSTSLRRRSDDLQEQDGTEADEMQALERKLAAKDAEAEQLRQQVAALTDESRGVLDHKDREIQDLAVRLERAEVSTVSGRAPLPHPHASVSEQQLVEQLQAAETRAERLRQQLYARMQYRTGDALVPGEANSAVEGEDEGQPPATVDELSRLVDAANRRALRLREHLVRLQGGRQRTTLHAPALPQVDEPAEHTMPGRGGRHGPGGAVAPDVPMRSAEPVIEHLMPARAAESSESSSTVSECGSADSSENPVQDSGQGPVTADALFKSGVQALVSQTAALGQQLATARQQLEGSKLRIAELEAQLATARVGFMAVVGDRDRALGDIRDILRALRSVMAERDELREHVAALELDKARLESELRAEIHELRAALAIADQDKNSCMEQIGQLETAVGVAAAAEHPSLAGVPEKIGAAEMVDIAIEGFKAPHDVLLWELGAGSD